MNNLRSYLGLSILAFSSPEMINNSILQESGSLIPRYEGCKTRRSKVKTSAQLKRRAAAKRNKKRH